MMHEAIQRSVKSSYTCQTLEVTVCAATAGHVTSQRRRHMLNSIGRSVSAARFIVRGFRRMLTAQSATKSFTGISLISRLDAGSFLPLSEMVRIGLLQASKQSGGTKGSPAGAACMCFEAGVWVVPVHAVRPRYQAFRGNMTICIAQHSTMAVQGISAAVC